MWAKFPACLIKRWTKSGLGQGAWNVQTLRHSAGKIMQLTVRQMGKEGQRLRHEEPRQFPLFLHLEQVTLRMTRRGPPWAATYTQTMEERRCPCDTLWVNLSRSKANISGPHVASQYRREGEVKESLPVIKLWTSWSLWAFPSSAPDSWPLSKQEGTTSCSLITQWHSKGALTKQRGSLHWRSSPSQGGSRALLALALRTHRTYATAQHSLALEACLSHILPFIIPSKIVFSQSCGPPQPKPCAVDFEDLPVIGNGLTEEGKWWSRGKGCLSSPFGTAP